MGYFEVANYRVPKWTFLEGHIYQRSFNALYGLRKCGLVNNWAAVTELMNVVRIAAKESFHMKHILAVLIVCFFAARMLVAQAPQQAPAPTEAQQMMGYFVGDWKLKGTMKVSPTGPGGPFTATEHSEWVPGSFFVETHSSVQSPMGNIRGVRVMEYNPADKVYTYNAYNSLGEHQVALGHAQGNVWTWTAEEKMNGVTVNGRYTITLVSPTSYTFKSEVATPSGGWSTAIEGKATRSQ